MITIENGRRVPRNLQLIAMDGVPTSDEITASPRAEIHLSPGGRAEFVVMTPAAGGFSQLVSRKYDTGPDGAANPDRVIANIVSGNQLPESRTLHEASTGPTWRFTGLAGLSPARTRTLYFSEDREDLKVPGKPAKYFVTLEGRTPKISHATESTPTSLCYSTPSICLTGTGRARSIRPSNCGWISGRPKLWAHFFSIATSWSMKTVE
jgi:hypothetical protein